jgi:integrase
MSSAEPQILHLPEPPVTVGDVFREYLEHLTTRVAAGDYSKHAYTDACRELRRFGDEHGHQTMPDCRQRDVTKWLEVHSQWGNYTKKRILNTILRPFNWAVDEELIEASPYRRPRNLKLRTRPRRPAEEWEYLVLMRVTSGRSIRGSIKLPAGRDLTVGPSPGSRALKRALFVLFHTGIRTCELRSLRWCDVDFQAVDRYGNPAPCLWIRNHKGGKLSGDLGDRQVGLTVKTVRFLKILQRRAPLWQEHVCLNGNGEPWADHHAFARHFARWRDRAGLPSDLSAYCFRHLYVTRATKNGVGERQIADQVGHRSTRMVSHYSHAAGDAGHLCRVAEQVSRRQRKPPPEKRTDQSGWDLPLWPE